MAVQQVTDKDFAQLLQDNDTVVVKYFADWCGSCKLVAPKYVKLSEKPEYEGKVTFLDVNAEDNPAAREAAGKVSNLPFFAVFKNGEPVEGDDTSKIEYVEELLQKHLN